MYAQIELIASLKKEYGRQKKLLDRLERRSRELPSGSLAYKKGNYYRVISGETGTRQIPIPRAWPGHNSLVRELQEARHIKRALPVLRKNVQSYKKALDNLRVYDFLREFHALPSCYQDFTPDILIPEGDLDPEAWETASYPANEAYPEQLRFESDGGLFTRSKSEAMIATKLEQYRIPFHYEEKLTLGSQTLYPDFFALRLSDRKCICWEHFGRMDDPNYAAHTMEKLSLYSSRGWRLGDNLIMTWETAASPLTFRQINSCIETYLLRSNQ